MKPAIRKWGQHKAFRKIIARRFIQDEQYMKKAILPDVPCGGAYNMYPFYTTMLELVYTDVSLFSGLYISRKKPDPTKPKTTSVYKLQDTAWDILTTCGARRQISAPDEITRIAFCSWTSSIFNTKILAAFYQTALDTLTIKINEEDITCIAPKLDTSTANELLDILDCLTWLNRALVQEGKNIDGKVQVAKADIDSFCVSVTVPFSPSYMEEVRREEARFRSMYGHIVATFQ